ncbi:methyltransferase domain-containing protein [Natronobiforma cellulositropha]|uniref:methyltransferase domain-containing protein n=1 Tax=Natronobiforma cellulositropha TaxID=1679076 RepID=UPI0021D5E813|nr:methyltransferase domain-containing protein [Natronobiforma cellulositropha]
MARSPSEYEDHLERSRAVWDQRSDSYGRSERELAAIRETAIDHLGLERGDRVLEVGCGPGVNLARLRSDVGEHGAVVALDYSPEMVADADTRVEGHGWENVEVRLADATQATFDRGFDAALATLSLSLMPDVEATVETIARALAPGGTLVVFDLRPVPSGPASVVNPLVRRFLRWYANWNPDGDVLASLEAAFDECTVVETYAAGIGYVAVCRSG